MSATRVAASMRKAADEAWRKHKQSCLTCSKGVHCPVGRNLLSYAELMREQEELLKSPLEPDYVQDELFPGGFA